MDIEQMRIRMGEMAAEIERLNSAWHVETLTRKDSLIARQEEENDRIKTENSRLQSIIDESIEAPDAIKLLQRVAASTTESIAARQSCAECGDNDSGLALYCVRCIDKMQQSPSPDSSKMEHTTQSPAVAVPDEWKNLVKEMCDSFHDIFPEFDDQDVAHLEIVGLLNRAKSLLSGCVTSPRITEQDSDGYVCGDNYEFGLWSRRNIEAFIADGNRVGGVTEQDVRRIIACYQQFHPADYIAEYLDDWITASNSNYKSLLNKLNAKPESEST